MTFIKYSFLANVIFLLQFFNCNGQNKIAADVWAGKYELLAIRPADKKNTVIDTLTINRVANVNAAKVAYRQGLDPRRWQIVSVKSNDTISAKPFLYFPQEKYDDYKEFGWTALYLADKINALDAGHIFLVKTTPNTTLTIMGEKYFTTTGIFGVRLHYGIFELRRLEH